VILGKTAPHFAPHAAPTAPPSEDGKSAEFLGRKCHLPNLPTFGGAQRAFYGIDLFLLKIDSIDQFN
jgi:hypothetical protein